jgi:hypothetical protein
MKEQQSNRNIEAVVAALPVSRQSAFHQLANSRRQRKTHIAAPAVARRQLCLTNRPILAALRAAEFTEWQASGGDFLSSRHQPVS